MRRQVIYIDPYFGDGYDLAADLILVTHPHFDHSQTDKVENRNPDCLIITQDEAIRDGEHQVFEFGYVTVEAVEAGYNPLHDVGRCVGYVLTYGSIAGFLYNRSKWQCIVSLYRSLILAMIGGRIIWGIVCVIMLGMTGNAFTWQMFMAGAFLNAIPGIILQLAFIPALMVALNKTRLVRFHKEQKVGVRVMGK